MFLLVRVVAITVCCIVDVVGAVVFVIVVVVVLIIDVVFVFGDCGRSYSVSFASSPDLGYYFGCWCCSYYCCCMW